jgi:hypothetical protein
LQGRVTIKTNKNKNKIICFFHLISLFKYCL